MLQFDADEKLLPSHHSLVPLLLLVVLWVKEGIYVLRVELSHVGSGALVEEVIIIFRLDGPQVSKCGGRNSAGVSEHSSVRAFSAHHLGGKLKQQT